jgi:maltose-binding protein MalE
MEDSKKKLVMSVVIVICLIAAAAITYTNTKSGGGTGGAPANATIQVKCSNPECKATYEMSEKEYQQLTMEKDQTKGPAPIRCKKCGKDTVYRVEAAEKKVRDK